MLPGQFCNDVWSEEIEAHIEHRCKAFLISDMHEVAKQFFCNLGGSGSCGRGDGILEELILLG
jgi:hypothetical protein